MVSDKRQYRSKVVWKRYGTNPEGKNELNFGLFAGQWHRSFREAKTARRWATPNEDRQMRSIWRKFASVAQSFHEGRSS